LSRDPDRFRRARCGERTELQCGGAEQNHGAVGEGRGAIDFASVQRRPVLAAQIFQRRTVLADRDPGMMPRDSRVVDEHGRVARASKYVLAAGQRDFTIAKNEATRAHDIESASRGQRFDRHFAAKGVAVTVNRPDKSGGARIVANDGAKLGHEAREGSVGYEGAAPERLVNLVLGQRSGPGVEQQLEQREQLRARMHDRATAYQLAPVPIEHAVPKPETHSDNSLRAGVMVVNQST
jgi:hypothetical protein